MAFHRCNKTIIVGSDEGMDAVYQEGNAYDDGDPKIAAAIARFPEHFDSPEPTPVVLKVDGKTIAKASAK